jgi:hypothetical protein
MGKNAVSVLKELHEKYQIGITLDKDILVEIGKLGEVSYSIAELQKRLDLLKGFNTEAEFSDRIIPVLGMAELGNEIGVSLLKQMYEENKDFHDRSILIIDVDSLESNIASPLLRNFFNLEQDTLLLSDIAIRSAFHKDKGIMPYLKDIYNQETDSIKEAILLAFGHIADRSDIPYLKEIYNVTKRNYLKILIASAIGKAGEVETAVDLLKNLFKRVGVDKQIIICEDINGFGKSKLAITQLNEVFRKKTFYRSKLKEICFLGVRNWAWLGNLLIFNGKRGRWKIFQIPKQYSFSSLPICNGIARV